jgi:hypothetical protein
MNYFNGITQGLIDEVLEVVYKYEDTMNISTAIGCLEFVKIQLIQDAQQDAEDDE